MSVAKGFTLVEVLMSTLIASVLTLMISDLSGASLSVFIKGYRLESHVSDLNATLFSMRQEVSQAVVDSEEGAELLYIEPNQDGAEDACIRFVYDEGGESKQGGFRFDSENRVIERYADYGENWSCDSGYWQDLHDTRFEIETLRFTYQEPILLLEIEATDSLMSVREHFYVSAYVSH